MALPQFSFLKARAPEHAARPVRARRRPAPRPRPRSFDLLRDPIDAVVVAVAAVAVVALAVLAVTMNAAATARVPGPAYGVGDPLPMPSPVVVRPSVWVIGDELVVGGGSRAWTSVVGARDHADVHVLAASGLGYTRTGKIGGTALTVQTALARVPSDAGAVVIVAGRADAGAGALQLAPAVVKAVRTAKSQASGAAVLIVGPAAAGSDPALVAVRDVLRRGAALSGAQFVDPIAGSWLAARDLQSDGVHLSAPGQAAVAKRMAPLLASALRG